MRMRRLVVIVMTAILSILILGMAPAAKAAPAKSPGTSAARVVPLVTCSGHGCDGTNPDSTGCSAGAITASIASGTITNIFIGAAYTVLVELRYSPTCRTVWARVKTNDPVATEQGIIHRNSDGRQAGCGPGTFPPIDGSLFGCFTTQLYDGGVTSSAEGIVTDKTSGSTAVLFTGSF